MEGGLILTAQRANITNITGRKAALRRFIMFTEFKNEPTQTVMLPRIPGDECQTVEVGINGRFYLLSRGEALELPRPIVEILQHGGIL